MGSIARKGIAEPVGKILQEKEAMEAMQKNQSNATAGPSEALSASSIASRRGMTARRRRPGLINEESTETLGAKGL